jgi:hypothetical protein
MKAQPSLSNSFGTSEYGLKPSASFFSLWYCSILGIRPLPILDDEIRAVVRVFSFEGEDSRSDHSVRKLVGFDAKVLRHAPELFRPAFHFLVSLLALLNLKDTLQVCLSRSQRSLELFEPFLGLAIPASLQREGASNARSGKIRLDLLALPQFPNVHKFPLPGRYIPPHIESTLHVLQAIAALAAEVESSG